MTPCATWHARASRPWQTLGVTFLDSECVRELAAWELLHLYVMELHAVVADTVELRRLRIREGEVFGT